MILGVGVCTLLIQRRCMTGGRSMYVTDTEEVHDTGGRSMYVTDTEEVHDTGGRSMYVTDTEEVHDTGRSM